MVIIEGTYLKFQAHIRHSKKMMTIIEGGAGDDKLPGGSWLSLQEVRREL